MGTATQRLSFRAEPQAARLPATSSARGPSTLELIATAFPMFRRRREPTQSPTCRRDVRTRINLLLCSDDSAHPLCSDAALQQMPPRATDSTA